ncbi:MAG: alkaline phosphatase family protein [Candidatus Thiodiazotropha taylori]|nr:alkaline phosphatase family protein [Candidatus Thiodiazotropha taylori]MCW4328204.1 alkaline phosphatase family protein [Candidatus Thiodiazotropha taylori]
MWISKPRLIFIGLDAADVDLIEHLASQGSLPTFASVIARAEAISIVNPPGLYVGAVWPTFFTGSSPASHGRYCRRQHRAGTYEDEFFQVEQIRGEPVWEEAEALGFKTAVVDVPKSLPNAHFKGVFVKDWGTHDPSRGGFQVFGWRPPKEIVAQYGLDFVGNCDRIERTVEGFRQFRDNLCARALSRARMIVDLLAEQKIEVMFTVFSETHCAGHQCWHLHDLDHELHNVSMRNQLGDPLDDVYSALDASIRTILAQLSPDDTFVLLASHGMGSHHSGVESLNELTSLIDCGLGGDPIDTPIPHLLSSHSAAFREQARFFPVPNNGAYAAFRLNIRDREPNGKIFPNEAEPFLDKLIQVFLSLREKNSGSPIFLSAIKTSEVFDGPLTGQLPDLLMEWNRAYPIRRIVTPWGELKNTDGKNPRTGDHASKGRVWVVGPSTKLRSSGTMEMSKLKDYILNVLAGYG